jgi:hypothetical protein
MGSGKPRYGPPDAPLDSFPLVSAICHEDRDPLLLFVLSELNTYLLGQTSDDRLSSRAAAQ